MTSVSVSASQNLGKSQPIQIISDHDNYVVTEAVLPRLAGVGIAEHKREVPVARTTRTMPLRSVTGKRAGDDDEHQRVMMMRRDSSHVYGNRQSAAVSVSAGACMRAYRHVLVVERHGRVVPGAVWPRLMRTAN